ncbi:T9SS type A sorting domain-containing protein [Flavobacterium collinsii]|uniref:Secretion system C-terminal sorting domain-containing protein n=1 Tax=Flavobacterium collinsii TaxID=1114861 RepID=A0A9W4TDC3_9FLAO|nr:T9SS type A sorting domain-containing protein [Flavobacterium collinsii]CAI2765889.1 conserved protein of unknown function precursor containing a type A C-terminal secretion signal [Flavobacterium collinsii]
MKKTLLFLIFNYTLSYAQNDGTLDTSFGKNGITITDLTSNGIDYAFDGIQLADHKILVGGYTSANSNSSLVLKYLPDGNLDLSFGTKGYSMIKFGNEKSDVRKIGIQSDGKIILSGRSGERFAYAAIARLNTDGTLDTTFGTNGITKNILGSESDLQSIHILPNDKMIAVGYVLNDNSDILILKLNADGTYDNSFGNNGVQVINFDSLSQRAFCSVMNGDKILIGGSVSNPTEASLLVQLNANGSIDTSFGTNGYRYVQFDSNAREDYDRFLSVKIDKDKIYAVGAKAITPLKYVINLAKFDINGTLDTTFSDDGKLLIDTKSDKDFINDLNILQDNSILLAGVTAVSNSSNSLLIKLNPDGTYKTNFGNKGIVLSNMNASNSTIQKVIVNEANLITVGVSSSRSANIGLAKYKNSNTLGIPENQLKSKSFNVFPNPVKDKLSITSLLDQKPDSITLINSKGQIILENKTNTEQINLENLAEGIYILKIQSNGLTENVKIIKY